VLAHEPTHLVVAKAADLDKDGAVEIVTGSFAFYPPLDRAGRITVWRRAAKP
jgi:predicted secreted protein